MAADGDVGTADFRAGRAGKPPTHRSLKHSPGLLSDRGRRNRSYRDRVESLIAAVHDIAAGCCSVKWVRRYLRVGGEVAAGWKALALGTNFHFSFGSGSYPASQTALLRKCKLPSVRIRSECTWLRSDHHPYKHAPTTINHSKSRIVIRSMRRGS